MKASSFPMPGQESLRTSPLQLRLSALIKRDGQKPGLACQKSAVMFLGIEHEPVDLGVIRDGSVEVGRLERS